MSESFRYAVGPAFEPGKEGIWFNLPADVYRVAPGISQSRLKAFNAEATPRHYAESLTRPKKVTEDMEFGTILHTAVLQPHLLGEAYHLRPATYPGAKGEKPWHGGADYCKDWIAEHSDRPIIDAEKQAKIAPITSRVLDMPVIGDMIKHGQKEVSFFKIDQETGVMLKCRLDCLATDMDGKTWILDPKKVRRGYADDVKFGIECADRGYDIQCASYLSITGASKFVFLAMEEDAPFEAQPFELDDSDVFAGLTKWRRILHKFIAAQNDDTWPGYTPVIKRLKLPAWAADRERERATAAYEH